MVNVGEKGETINADLVELIDSSNSRDWGQLFNVRMYSDAPIHARYLTDGTRDTLTDPATVKIEGDILITQPEITTMLSYLTFSNEDLPENNWDVKFTAKDTTTDTARITGKMIGLTMQAGESGWTWFHVIIESTTGVVAEP